MRNSQRHAIVLALLLFIVLGYQIYAQRVTATPGTHVIQTTQVSNTTSTVAVTTSTNFVPTPRSKITGCTATNGLPDAACTPGDVLPVTAKEICVSGYSKSVRHVTTSVKNNVFTSYGLPTTGHAKGAFEVDHLISLELGGSNDIANLWPETAAPLPGFHQKDKVENELHQRVCAGTMNLAQAQNIIATNWLAFYNAEHLEHATSTVDCISEGCP